MGWIIGHEGPGSILCALKKRLWATALNAGNSDSGWEHNSTWANFSIGIVITEQGLHNLKAVRTPSFLLFVPIFRTLYEY